MAELNARIIAKASATAAEEPVAGDLEVAELAVNTADGKLFTKHTDGSIVTISGGGIVNQSDFGYGREDSAYSYTFSDEDTSRPATGEATRWTSYGDDRILLSTTDKDGLGAGSDLYTLLSGDDVVIFVNGVEVFDGTLSGAADKNNARISLVFATVQSWITNLVASDVVGIRSSVFSRQPPVKPLVDGQVLTWIDANSQWEPATPSGGGGAVDSVNGETGTVSLGVIDMNDVRPDGFSGLTTYTASSDPTVQGTWNMSAGGGLLIYNVADEPAMSVFESGDQLTFAWSDGSTSGPYEVNNPTAYNSSNSRYMSFVGEPAIANPVLSGGVTLTAPGAYSAGDSQVLTWDGTNNQWRPADAFTGVVDSVNGQQGTVVLGLEDVNNVRPEGFTGLTAFTSDTTPNSQGLWNISSSNQTLYYSAADEAGMQVFQVGDQLTFNWSDGTSSGPYEINNVALVDGTSRYMTFLNSPIIANPVKSGAVILTAPGRYVATDGQVLTWVDANNQWEPGDYISKTTLKTETAAATDFADFQARIAAL